MAALNQAWRRTIMLLAALLIVLSLSLFYFPVPLPDKLTNAIPFKNFTPRPSPFHDVDLANTNLDTTNVGALIQALWSPLLLPITEKTFVGADGAKFELPVEPIFKKKLGKNLCILDVDTRQLDEEGEVFNPQTPSWDNLHRLSSGILAHYMYALIHGYDYKFVRAPDYSDRQGGWTKVIMTQELMKTHDYVLMIDEDAELRYPHMPLEWLMNYWNITPEVSIAMAADPDGEPNYDSKGKVMLNTGFVINQAKAPKTAEIYKVWAECPEEKIFKGCATWKREGFREQTAFSEYVRYNYQEGNVIKVLPCDEANGAPEAHDSGCNGQLVRHYWVNKDLPKREFSDGVMQGMVPLLHAGFGSQIMDLRNKTLKGNLILD